MSVLTPGKVALLQTFAAANLDDRQTRDVVAADLLELVPDLADTIVYWRDLALERLDGIDLDSTWPLCRCERDLVCQGCRNTVDGCGCVPVADAIAGAVDVR